MRKSVIFSHTTNGDTFGIKFIKHKTAPETWEQHFFIGDNDTHISNVTTAALLVKIERLKKAGYTCTYTMN